uniref:Saposin B-type domain-containing protein n=1 Tax=Panagrellus redivivus TaxID=6233 RepID=A0A7E4VPQ1_PANRE
MKLLLLLAFALLIIKTHSTLSPVKTVPENGLGCAFCQAFVADFAKEVAHGKGNVHQKVKRTCKKVAKKYEKACERAVDRVVNAILKGIQQHQATQIICRSIRMC